MAYTLTIAESEKFIPKALLKDYNKFIKNSKLKEDDFYGEDKGSSSSYNVKIKKATFTKVFKKAKNDKDKQIIPLSKKFNITFVGTGLTSRGTSNAGKGASIGGKQVEVLSETFICIYCAMKIAGTLKDYISDKGHTKWVNVKTASDLRSFASKYKILSYVENQFKDSEFIKYMNLSYAFLVEKEWHERVLAQVDAFFGQHNLTKKYKMMRADVLPSNVDPYEIFTNISKKIQTAYNFSRPVDKDKWNPADVWFYTDKAEKQLVDFKSKTIAKLNKDNKKSISSLNDLNTLIYNLYESKDLYPVSMKAPSGRSARVSNINEDSEIEQRLEFDRVDLGQNNLDVKLRFKIVTQKKKSKKVISKVAGYLKSKTDTGGYRLEVEVPGSGARFGSIGTENYQFIIANTDDSGIKKLQQFRKNSNSFSNMPNENKPGDGDLDWLGAKSSYYPALSKTKSGTEDYLEGYLQNLFNEVNNQNVKITGNKNKFILNKTIASEIAVAINSIKSKINKEITLENLYNLSASQGFRTGISKQQLQARGEKVIASKVTANNIFDSCFYIKVY